MSLQTLEQQRAKYALEQVQHLLTKSVDSKEWLSRANEMPAMIQMNGLGQTAAFYLSKGSVHETMYNTLSGWLRQRGLFDGDLIDGITKGDMHTYRAAQAEAQALLIWVKKFSKALCNTSEIQSEE